MDDPGVLDGLRKRLQRERAARREAENIAERVTSDFYRVNAELAAANESLRGFVAITAHDLRGPLTGMLGVASTLSRRWPDLTPEQIAEMLAVLHRQGHRMARLVDDLLTISRIDAGAVEAMAEVVGLRDVMADLLNDFDTRRDDIHVTLSDLYAVVDPDHLQRIVGNYVRNALTYGSPPIEVETRDAGAWVEIVVRDHGAGVPDDMVPLLFGKFVRGRGSAQAGGTGLGLSIVRGLAQVNGGDTWYEHNEPHGSCFGVRLRKRDAA